MAKKVESSPEVVTGNISITDFKELPQEGTSEKRLRIGEVLIAELDGNGNETKTFVTNEFSAMTYFSNESKFRIKKKG